MKTFFGIIFGSLLCATATVLGMVYFSNTAKVQVEHVLVGNGKTVVDNVKAFNLTEEQIVRSLEDRSVPIQPIGQLWGFTTDQKVSLSVLQTKSTEDGVVVWVKLASVAIMQPPTPDPKVETSTKPGGSTSRSTPPPALPITIRLAGIAKMHYELVAGEWHLFDVTSVTLRATQK
jgi:hypothetical protein